MHLFTKDFPWNNKTSSYKTKFWPTGHKAEEMNDIFGWLCNGYLPTTIPKLVNLGYPKFEFPCSSSTYFSLIHPSTHAAWLGWVPKQSLNGPPPLMIKACSDTASEQTEKWRCENAPQPICERGFPSKSSDSVCFYPYLLCYCSRYVPLLRGNISLSTYESKVLTYQILSGAE